MTERNQVVTEGSREATCCNLIDIENYKCSEREVQQPESNGTRLQKTCKSVFGQNAESSKGTKDCKYTNNAVNRTSQDIQHAPAELTPLQPHLHHYNIERRENRQEKDIIAKEDTVSTKNSSAGEDEEAYEELICLVRQFYVERPGNPAAIAYQNIETC